MKVQAGETVLLRHHGVLQWVRVLLAAPARPDGTQRITVREVSPYGRTHAVTLGRTAEVEWVA